MDESTESMNDESMDRHSVDGKSLEEWEHERRSVAMLAPGAWALRREQALGLLGTVIKLGRRTQN